MVFLFPLFINAETPQEKWIEKLRQCESQGRDYITILDSNNKYSYGSLQFQLDTWLGFGKQYGFLPKEFTKAEAKLLIHNPHLQKAIAREMLDNGLDFHWKNCRDKKIGYRYPISIRED